MIQGGSSMITLYIQVSKICSIFFWGWLYIPLKIYPGSTGTGVSRNAKLPPAEKRHHASDSTGSNQYFIDGDSVGWTVISWWGLEVMIYVG